MVDPARLCPARRRRHRPVTLRAAAAAGAPGRRRRRRAPPAARHRDRPVGHLHGHDRRRGDGRRRRRPRQRPAADRGDRRAAGVRPRADAARAAGAHRGTALAPGALRSPHRRRRLRLGPAGGRRARLRLHAMRQPDPGGGDLGERRLGKNDPHRAGIRARLGARAARAHARRQTSVRPRAQGGPRPGAAARAGDDHGPHGGRDPHQPGRQLRPVRRPAHPGRQPHGLARVLERGDRPAAPDHGPSAEVRSRERLRRVRQLGDGRPSCRTRREPGHPARRRPAAAAARRRSRIHGNRGLVQHPRATARRRSARCRGGWCWSTSGPTPASTAFARCPI